MDDETTLTHPRTFSGGLAALIRLAERETEERKPFEWPGEFTTILDAEFDR